ncbi:MAG: DUF58 domain-containing protein [Defluviitaleaceae bacterium]|nr:DUF58 domain-containing protein [Defluviitaleaceae bacterium]
MTVFWSRLLLLFIVLCVCYIYMRYKCIKRLQYKRHFKNAGAFEGERAVLIEEIYNPTYFPLFFIDVESYMPGELRLIGQGKLETGGRQEDSLDGSAMQLFISRFFLLPYTKIVRSIDVSCVRRGHYTLDFVTVFFFFSAIYFKSKASFYVYPRTLPLAKSNPLEQAAMHTDITEKRLIADPFNLYGVRDYLPGDPFSHINFKATAKTGSWKVNQRDYTAGRNFMVFIDFYSSMHHDSLPTPVYHARMERALSFAADMVQKSIRLGYAAGFSANCKLTNGMGYVKFPMERGHVHYIEMLCLMAQIRLQAGYSFDWLLRSHIDGLFNAEIYIMTADNPAPYREAIDILRLTGNSVTVIMLRDTEKESGEIAA